MWRLGKVPRKRSGRAVLFACVGIAFFISRFPQYRDGNTTPDHGRHRDVDAGFAVLPSGAVKGGADALPAEKREDKAGNIGFADEVAAKEALHAAIGGFRLGF